MIAHFPYPNVFADEAIGFDMANNTVSITFGIVMSSEPVPPAKRSMAVVERLVLPVSGAQRLCLTLYKYLRAQGLAPNRVVVGDHTAQ